ncbi:MAG: ATP-binding cassette domain-containing protein [Clostridiales bacterium]|nr:ATP-binding cassette domain-containing protein [Candidatus Coliplasma equi]
MYFKGQRICAGTKSYYDAIKEARKKQKEDIAAIKAQNLPDEAAQIEAINKNTKDFINAQREAIKSARFDHKHSDREYAKTLIAALEEEYKEKFEAAKGDKEETAKLKKEYSDKLRIARNTRLITQIQMIFQDPTASLNPRMTVKEIISEGLVINGIKDKQYLEDKVYEILELVGLVREHAGRYPHEFSGGQKQRIGIARSVVMRPEMIIADEPVSALDVSIQAQVINLLNDLRSQLGLTILFIAHDLSVVKYFSDRIGVMYYGKMVELASSDELFAHPMHPYTRSLLSAIPLPDPHSEKNRTRIVYNKLADHDYSVQGPTMREIIPGHFVYCNDAEEQKYKEEFGL